MTDTANQQDFNQIALSKLTRVFGQQEAESLLSRTLGTMHKERLGSADDLYQFSSTLSRSGDPITAAVGGMLGLTALLHGASGG